MRREELMDSQNQITYRKLAFVLVAGLWAPASWLISLNVIYAGYTGIEHRIYLIALHPIYGLLPMAVLWAAGIFLAYKAVDWIRRPFEKPEMLALTLGAHLGLACLTFGLAVFLFGGT